MKHRGKKGTENNYHGISQLWDHNKQTNLGAESQERGWGEQLKK